MCAVSGWSSWYSSHLDLRPSNEIEEHTSELQKFKLSNAEWDALEVFQDIMMASNSLLLLGLFSYHLVWKIPHAFQQWLSAEKIPTLCAPFIWRSQIQVGGVSGSPPRDSTHCPARSWQAHWLSYSCWTGTSIHAGNGYIVDYCYIAWPYLPIRAAVDPSQKLDWFYNHMPEKYGDAKAIFIQAVCIC